MNIKKQLDTCESYKRGSIVYACIALFDKTTDVVYLVAGLLLVILSLMMMGVSFYNVYQAFGNPDILGETILNTVSFIVISIAVLDVGKYLIEEEVVRDKELRSPEEARKTLTKFLVIIIIAASLEGLVYIFTAGKIDLSLLLYPAILLISIAVLILSLSFFQRTSVSVEKRTSD
jgi:hypothetical protein